MPENNEKYPKMVVSILYDPINSSKSKDNGKNMKWNKAIHFRSCTRQ